ncbi:MAG TPA: DUF6766 family protein [Solirubrobacteraceae bacterium]|jgi:hypothetical protein
MRFLRENSLSLVFLVIFLATLAGQAIAGHGQFNHEQILHHGDAISFGRYLTSSQFAADVAENWQSEYLQFTLYIFTTVWLLQRGSPESKPLDSAGTESDEEQKVGRYATEDSPRWARVGGLRTAIYGNSLVIVMTTIWLLSWLAQSIAGASAYNADQLDHQAATLSWFHYLGSSDFWDNTLQNWQSEFLAVGSMAVLSIYLRQRGSPESKPVGTSHEATGVES